MQASPLQLEAYFLKSMKFTLNNSLETLAQQPVEIFGPEIKVQERTVFDRAQKLWRSEVRVTALDKGKENVPYTFDVTMIGFFRVHESYPAEHVELMAKTNAPALIYSAIREIVGNMTSRSPFPMMFLPSVTFLKAEKEDSKGRRQRKPTNRKKTVV